MDNSLSKRGRSVSVTSGNMSVSSISLSAAINSSVSRSSNTIANLVGNRQSDVDTSISALKRKNDNHGDVVKSMKHRNRRNPLMEAIVSGNVEFVKFLKGRMAIYNKQNVISAGGRGLVIPFELLGDDSLKVWLEKKLGFAEETFGEGMALILPGNKVEELNKALNPQQVSTSSVNSFTIYEGKESTCDGGDSVVATPMAGVRRPGGGDPMTGTSGSHRPGHNTQSRPRSGTSSVAATPKGALAAGIGGLDTASRTHSKNGRQPTSGMKLSSQTTLSASISSAIKEGTKRDHSHSHTSSKHHHRPHPSGSRSGVRSISENLFNNSNISTSRGTAEVPTPLHRRPAPAPMAFPDTDPPAAVDGVTKAKSPQQFSRQLSVSTSVDEDEEEMKQFGEFSLGSGSSSNNSGLWHPGASNSNSRSSSRTGSNSAQGRREGGGTPFSPTAELAGGLNKLHMGSSCCRGGGSSSACSDPAESVVGPADGGGSSNLFCASSVPAPAPAPAAAAAPVRALRSNSATLSAPKPVDPAHTCEYDSDDTVQDSGGEEEVEAEAPAAPAPTLVRMMSTRARAQSQPVPVLPQFSCEVSTDVAPAGPTIVRPAAVITRTRSGRNGEEEAEEAPMSTARDEEDDAELASTAGIVKPACAAGSRPAQPEGSAQATMSTTRRLMAARQSPLPRSPTLVRASLSKIGHSDNEPADTDTLAASCVTLDVGTDIGIGLGDTSPIEKLPSKSAVHSPEDATAGDLDDDMSGSQTPPNGMAMNFGSVIDDSFVGLGFPDETAVGGPTISRRSSSMGGSFCMGIRAGYDDSDSSINNSDHASSSFHHLDLDLAVGGDVGSGSGQMAATDSDGVDDDELDRTEILDDDMDGGGVGGVSSSGNAPIRRSSSFSSGNARTSAGSSSSSGFQLRKCETYRPPSKRGESSKPAASKRSMSCNGSLHSSSVLGGGPDIFALARTASSFSAASSSSSATPCKSSGAFDSALSKAFSTPVVERYDFLHSEAAHPSALRRLLTKYADMLSLSTAGTPIGMSMGVGMGQHHRLSAGVTIPTIAEEDDFSQSPSQGRGGTGSGSSSHNNSFYAIAPGRAPGFTDDEFSSAFAGGLPQRPRSGVDSSCPPGVMRPALNRSMSTNSFLSPGGTARFVAGIGSDIGVGAFPGAGGGDSDGTDMLSIAVPETAALAGDGDGAPGTRCRRRDEMLNSGVGSGSVRSRAQTLNGLNSAIAPLSRQGSEDADPLQLVPAPFSSKRSKGHDGSASRASPFLFGEDPDDDEDDAGRVASLRSPVFGHSAVGGQGHLYSRHRRSLSVPTVPALHTELPCTGLAVASAPGDTSFTTFSPGAFPRPSLTSAGLLRTGTTNSFLQRHQPSPGPDVGLINPALDVSALNSSMLNDSVMDTSVVDEAAGAQSRAKRRMRQSQAKWRRVSMSYQRREERGEGAGGALSPVPGVGAAIDGGSVPSSASKPLQTRTPGSLTKMHSLFSFDSGGRSQGRVQAQRKQRRSSIVDMTRSSSSRDMREMRRRSSVAMGGAVRLGMLAEGDMDDGEDGDEQVTPETQLVESSNSLTATATDMQIAMAHYQSPSAVYLDENNWRYAVVGGTYQHCIENSVPVVLPPGVGDPRVLSVRFERSITGSPLDVSLVLRVYDPHRRQEPFRSVPLGNSWVWYRVNPQGFLLGPRDLSPGAVGSLYYTPSHPVECLNRTASGTGTGVWAGEEEDDGICASFGELDCHVGDAGAVQRRPFGAPSRARVPVGGVYLHNMCTLRAVLEFLLPTAGTGVVEGSAGARSSRRNLGGAATRQKLLAEMACYKRVNRAFAAVVLHNVVNQLSRIIPGPVKGKGSGNGNGNSMTTAQWGGFVARFPSGRYLSEGACKQVYCIVKADTGEKFALSSMDMGTLVEERGVEMAAISAELEISLLCSGLLTGTRVCPNFLHVYSLFNCAQPPAEKHWVRSAAQGGGEVVAATRSKPGAVSGYQYMRMEFCSYGDTEELVRARRHLSASCVRTSLFQMLYSCYAAREQLSLRHYDVKLLNFFATSVDDLVASSGGTAGAAEVEVLYGFCDAVYMIPFVPLSAGAGAAAGAGNDNILVKLADFGTSTIARGELNDAINENQFTTLENTPVEYLLLGSSARQAYSADTYQLGLCMFHLCSGEEPYEELVEALKCPPQLMRRMRKIWEPKPTGGRGGRKNAELSEESPYGIVQGVIETLLCDEDDAEPPGDVMYHTLYRYLVLFYTHSELTQQYLHDLSNFIEDELGCCAMVRLLCESLGLKSTVSTGEPDGSPCVSCCSEERLTCAREGLAGVKQSRQSAAHQFVVDRHQWSVQFGAHPVMKRCVSPS